MKISWLVLTHNRFELVDKSFSHNLACAGAKHDELIWADNGSTDGTLGYAEFICPDVLIKYKNNVGVPKAYNQLFSAATGDLLVITGCDMLMPDNWLLTLKTYMEKIPNTAVASMYSAPLDKCPERVRGERTEINGLPIVPGMPMGRKIFTKDFLKKVGYFREEFGLYGWEDVEWGLRAERVAKELGLLNYVIPDQIPTHMGKTEDSPEYKAWKKAQSDDPAKHALMEWCRVNNYPYHNPFN